MFKAVVRRAGVMVMATAAAWIPGYAGSAPPPSMEQMWVIIQQQQRDLKQQRREILVLKRKLAGQESVAKAAAAEETKAAVAPPGAAGSQTQAAPGAAEGAQAAAPAGSPAAEAGATTAEAKWYDRLKFTGGVDVGSDFVRAIGRRDISTAYLDRAWIGVESQVDPWVNARIVVHHESGGADFEVDEGVITLANEEQSPLFLALGRMYLPFGSYKSHLISDTLPLTLGENRQEAIQAGFKSEGFTGSGYLYNGPARRFTKSDTLEQWGLGFSYAHKSDDLEWNAGIGAINSIADGRGLEGILTGNGVVVSAMDHHVGAGNIYGNVTWQGVSLIGEYTAATREFSVVEVPWGVAGAKPVAWSTELGYTWELLGKETTVAASYQETAEAVSLGLPKRRLLFGVGMGIFPHTTLSAEYSQDRDYSILQGGTGEHGHAGRFKLGVEF